MVEQGSNLYAQMKSCPAIHCPSVSLQRTPPDLYGLNEQLIDENVLISPISFSDPLKKKMSILLDFVESKLRADEMKFSCSWCSCRLGKFY